METRPGPSHSPSEKLEQRRRASKKWTDTWLSCGGTSEHLALMHAQRESYVRLYQQGPLGWGPVPEGCVETQDAKTARHWRFDIFYSSVREHIRSIHIPLLDLVLDLEFKSPLSLGDLPTVLPSLWMLESEPTPVSDGSIWWSRECAPNQGFLWESLLKYKWMQGACHTEPDQIADRCLAACASGRLPVDLDGDTVIAYRIDPAQLQKDIAKEKKRRKGDNWPTFASSPTPIPTPEPGT